MKHANKCAVNGANLTVSEMIENHPKCDCDGYHTFEELYDHRIALWIKLARCFNAMHEGLKIIERNPEKENPVWRSKRHSDGELAFGGEWFLLGINREKGIQMTYHLPIKEWENTNFAATLNQAPEFDGHTSDDVLERLRRTI